MVSSSDRLVHVPLYGGAMSVSAPESFSDASRFRQIPDHQEVLVGLDSDASLIVELLDLASTSDHPYAAST